MKHYNNLKKLRNEKGLTQTQLGEIFGLSKTAISLYESGKRNMDISLIINLSKYFQCSADYLLGITTTKTTSISLNIDEDILKKLEKLDDESKEELNKYLEYLKVRQSLGRKDENCAGLDENKIG